MPCDTVRKLGETKEQRQQKIDAALSTLEQRLKAGAVRLVVGADGAIAFAGWGKTDRDDVSDVCAFRTLASRDSWALRQARASAEMLAGRKVDERLVTAGRHSHDGGHSWHPGHK